MTVSTRRRIAVVLGRRAVADGAAIVRDAVRDGVDVLLLPVGYPLSDHQRRTVSEAIEAAFDSGVRLDAVLVPTRDALAREVGTTEVVVLAAARERRILVRALRSR